jgi:hypothetical protein
MLKMMVYFVCHYLPAEFQAPNTPAMAKTLTMWAALAGSWVQAVPPMANLRRLAMVIKLPLNSTASVSPKL